MFCHLFVRLIQLLSFQFLHHPEEDGAQRQAVKTLREERRVHFHVEGLHHVGLQHRQHRDGPQQGGLRRHGNTLHNQKVAVDFLNASEIPFGD